MNKRLKQLAEQAGMTDDKFGMYFANDKHNEDGVDLEKFAELIVAECVSVIQEELDSGQYSQPVHTGFRVSKNLIKEHFGVEE